MSSLSQAASSVEKRTNARYWIVVMLFIVTSFNYGDRATLSIAGSEMAKDIGLDPVGMGYGRCEQVPDMRSSYSSGAHPRGTS